MGYTNTADFPKVIIFDWDDTICPSSFVDRYNIDNVDDMPANMQRLFTEIAKSAERCLQEASTHGEVIIITNSDDGWVKFSCERFVPRLLPVLHKYRIVSARTDYEKFYPGQPLCWKAAAFAHEVNQLYESQSGSSEESDDTNTSCQSMVSTDVSSEDSFPVSKNVTPSSKLHREIISFGDSMEERTAVRIVANQLSAVPKSVMFISAPTPLQIIGQLHMLTQHMTYVCDHESCLDLEISPDQAQRGAESFMRRSSRHSSAVKDCSQIHDDANKELSISSPPVVASSVSVSSNHNQGAVRRSYTE